MRVTVVTCVVNQTMVFAVLRKGMAMTEDTISRQMAIDVLCKIFPADPMRNDYTKGIACGAALAKTYVEQLPSAQPEEVIPHRNYKYLSDYWCECGWHLGKKGNVKYCSECGRKVNWDG